MFHGVYADGKGNNTKTYYAITVESGDTLWTIAQRFVDDRTDIRKLIYEISDINDLESANLAIGQQLIIPI